MSLAAQTRDAARARPFLYDALRAGVVNYTAAARTLDVDGETEAVATALRRFAEELDDYDPPAGDARVSMQSGLGPADGADPLVTVGDRSLAAGGGSLTGIVATGDVSPRLLGDVLGRLRATDIEVEVAAADGDSLIVAVGRRDGPDALRVVEAVVS
ncbi:DUF7523 family protein [Haloarcula sp. GH36]|uniref:DUF7523 family protein n=1 Tax=Haloarcula montana TaxID=3111776 RepID=UPI002D78E21A|nr:hypothetical protein [Haloarcula sp. GH36]